MAMDKILENIDTQNTTTQKYFYITILLIIGVSWFGIFDDLSADFLNDSLIDAGIAFGSARLINAIISVIQTTTIDLLIFEAEIGQVLDPINDLVEQYSSMMMLAIGSLVIQKLLLEIISDLFFKIALTISGFLLIAAWIRGNVPLLKPFFKTFVSLVFLRFLLVMVVLLNSVVDSIFVEPQMEEDLATIENYPVELRALQEQSSVSAELREQLENEINVLEDERVLLEKSIQPDTEKLQKVKASISIIEEEIRAVQSKLSTTERYNFFNENEQVKALQESLSAEKEKAESIALKLEKATERIEEIDQSINAAEKSLSGESTGFFSGISDRVSSLTQSMGNIREQLRPTVLMENATEVTESVLRTMALFIFRTLILPLLFLFLLVKSIKFIWNIDLQEKYQKHRIAKKQSQLAKSENADMEAGKNV